MNKKNKEMAIFIKCPSCGEEYNELIENKCPNCGCPRPVEETESKDTKSDKTTEQSLCIDGDVPYPFEFVGIFGAVYSYFSKDGKINVLKIILISLVEALIGVAFTLCGWGLSLTGLKKAPALFFFIGIPVCAHAFYALVKYVSLRIIGRKSSKYSEKTVRWILFFIEILVGAVQILIAYLIALADSKDNWVIVFALLGIGIIIGGIWSIIKYYLLNKRTSQSHTISDSNE